MVGVMKTGSCSRRVYARSERKSMFSDGGGRMVGAIEVELESSESRPDAGDLPLL